MKIIEALKTVKLNKVKINDLQAKIAANSATLNYETPPYGDRQSAQVAEWVQSCLDLSQQNVLLLVAIQRTNLQTEVTIELDNQRVTKTIAAWVWRRREYATIDMQTIGKLTDRNLREGTMPNSVAGGAPVEVKLVRHYDPAERDTKLMVYRDEPTRIDMALELVNATTDLADITPSRRAPRPPASPSPDDDIPF